ncbi:MAG: HlyD family efflux transporter periplasmic adaptor subunit [SAR324 cluster bacterium]|nr:HlyD family efflux transporter periplasmic adaptor subunit [SAR324 cluster bacterium]
MNIIKNLITAKVGYRLLIAIDVLLIGFLGMNLLARMKKPPAEIPLPKPVIRVETKRVQPENVQVQISGFGEAKATRSVRIAAAVAGKITKVHEKLAAGRFFRQDEILFEIDQRDYLSIYKDARATLSQLGNTIERLHFEQEIANARLTTLTRNRDLSHEEFERLRQLYLKRKIGTRTEVDAAERSYNATLDQLNQIRQAVGTYPLQIKEVKYRLESAEANVFRAKTNLERCLVRAPFSGRVKEVSLEVGQYVAPGQGLLLLAEDTTLEIDVPIDSNDGRKWLLFNKDSVSQEKFWFSSLQRVPVGIRWTEDPTSPAWQGILQRVSKFDKQTRTMTVVVSVNTQLTDSEQGNLPLVEGMFCSVTIPGKMMRQVYRLPRWAVGFNNTVYLFVEGRLKTIPVTIARIQKDEVFVSGGLKTGDIVVITRLIDPLENSLLEIVTQN